MVHSISAAVEAPAERVSQPSSPPRSPPNPSPPSLKQAPASSNLGIYPPGESKSIKFERPGWVKIYCNIHPQMIAHVLVLGNSHYDLTDEQGLFVISDVPDGSYALRTWHEFGGAVQHQIEVSGGSLHRWNLEIREDRKFIQHSNKFGKVYSGKY